MGTAVAAARLDDDYYGRTLEENENEYKIQISCITTHFLFITLVIVLFDFCVPANVQRSSQLPTMLVANH